MGSALATFTGQNYGYGDMKRVRRGIRSTIVMGVLYCILVIAVAMTASTVLAGLFVDASESRAGEVIACTAQFIRYIGVFMLLLAVLFRCAMPYREWDTEINRCSRAWQKWQHESP